MELDLAWQQHVRLPGELLRRLIERHREPHRRYHTVDHVVWVTRHVRELVDTDGVEVADRGAVVAAAVFHDAVYDPTAPPSTRCAPSTPTCPTTPGGPVVPRC